jgi:hypothetical protein
MGMIGKRKLHNNGDLQMKAVVRLILTATAVAGASLATSPTILSAQAKDSTVSQTVTHGARTLKHNVVKTSRRLAHKTNRAAHKTSLATSNLIHGHRILCGDGTWASRDNPSCADHDGLAARQPYDKDKDNQ